MNYDLRELDANYLASEMSDLLLSLGEMLHVLGEELPTDNEARPSVVVAGAAVQRASELLRLLECAISTDEIQE